MTPYYDHDGVTLYLGACIDVLATLPAACADLVLTDPPYTERVHVNARTNRGRRGFGKDDDRGRGGGSEKRSDGTVIHSASLVDFPDFTEEDSAVAFAAIARVARRWVVATVAFEHASSLYQSSPDGTRSIRVGAWTKIGPVPQMTGDRPGQGWEAIIMLHATGDDAEKMRWNGGGRSAVYHHRPEMRGAYPTQKPESLITALLADFGEPPGLVVDPFCGAGTTAVCAWRRGHRVISCDIREAALEIAAKRIEAEQRQGRLPVTTLHGPASKRQSALF